MTKMSRAVTETVEILNGTLNVKDPQDEEILQQSDKTEESSVTLTQPFTSKAVRLGPLDSINVKCGAFLC